MIGLVGVTQPILTSETHGFLIYLVRDANLVLLLEEDGMWRIYDVSNRHLYIVKDPQLVEDLAAHGFIQENPGAYLEPPNAPQKDRVIYDLTAAVLPYLGDHLPLAHTLMARDASSTRGSYTTTQAEILEGLTKEVAETTNAHLFSAIVSMHHPLAADGGIYQGQNGRWRILYRDDDTPTVALRASVVQTLIDCGLIERYPDGDRYYQARGCSNCHALSRDGETLARDCLRGDYDPSDMRVGSRDLSAVGEHAGANPDTLLRTTLERALYWATLSHELETEPDVRDAIAGTIASLQPLAESRAGSRDVDSIQQLAQENARRRLDKN